MLVKEASKESDGEWGTQRRKEESVQKRAVSIPDNTGADLLTSPFAPRKKRETGGKKERDEKRRKKLTQVKTRGLSVLLTA